MQEVAIIGLPDEKWGEAVHAVVVLKPDAAPDAAALTAFCREKLAGYKRPRGFPFLADDEVPRTATGKVLHRKLKDVVLERQS